MRLDHHYPDIVLIYWPGEFHLENCAIAAQQRLDRIARKPGTDAIRMLLAASNR